VTSRQFLVVFAAGFSAALAVLIPLNMYADPYGLFRSSRTRSLPVYGEERIAKYLYSLRYIPENFDGILLGSSVSDNLDPRQFSGYRIYNASINGGNVEDLRPIAENVYGKSTLKLTIVCIHRYLTLDHDRKTDLMTPRQYWGALGSPQLLTAYLSALAVRRGLVHGEYDEMGTLREGADVDVATVRKTIDKAVGAIRRGQASVGNYSIDPVALAGLDHVLTTARRRSQRMLVFYPPVPAPILAIRSAEFARYRDTVSSLLRPGDAVVDFNDPSYVDLRADLRNFEDAVHLSKSGAASVMSELSRTVAELDAARPAAVAEAVRR
jgi:hypothetical protein